MFEGWRPNERIRLANGQVWQIADDSSSLLQRRDPKVTVRRGALGPSTSTSRATTDLLG
jgi:hypothetical protein